VAERGYPEQHAQRTGLFWFVNTIVIEQVPKDLLLTEVDILGMLMMVANTFQGTQNGCDLYQKTSSRGNSKCE
jgi:hypothetical protein